MRTIAPALALPLIVLVVGSSACRSAHTAASNERPPPRWSYVPDLPVSRSPFSTVHANFKERLEQPYVYVDVVGSYTGTGRRLSELVERMQASHVEASGPPFALFYDDPGRVDAAALRSRACIPVERQPDAAARLEYDILPQANVVYAVIAGPYPEVARAYPGVYAYLSRMGWIENGPLREIYLVPPGSVKDFDELLCEVQIPAAPRP